MTERKQVLEGKMYPLELGYIGVVNRSQVPKEGDGEGRGGERKRERGSSRMHMAFLGSRKHGIVGIWHENTSLSPY